MLLMLSVCVTAILAQGGRAACGSSQVFTLVSLDCSTTVHVMLLTCAQLPKRLCFRFWSWLFQAQQVIGTLFVHPVSRAMLAHTLHTVAAVRV